MPAARIGASEEERLADLYRYGILDTPPEETFDRIASLAVDLLNVPTAFVSFIDRDRQWFKTRTGLELPQTHRDRAFCAHTILGDNILVVPDAARDDRFGDNPLVLGPPFIRFYAGAPLCSSQGYRIGTLAVADSIPRPGGLTEREKHALGAMAAIVTDALELRYNKMLLERQQKILEESETSYRVLFENNPLPMCVYDISTLRLLAVNPAAIAHYGYSRDEFLQMSMRDLQVADDLPRLLTANPAGSSIRRTSLQRHRKRTGEIMHVEVYSHELVYAGHFSRLIQINDVTERIRMEEQLRQSQKMEAIGQLAGGIAHDFNNLLTIINGYAALLLERMQAAEPLRREIETIHNAGERAAALTQQLLAFSRKQLLNLELIDLNEIVSGMQYLLDRLLRADIQLFVQLEPNLKKIFGDPSRMQQVVMNLVINASDALPKGGRITIRTENRYLESACDEFDESPPGDYVVLTVADTGIGMSEQTRARAFEPFFTTKGRKGTGLGLPTVYGIVTQTGGRIRLESEIGKGTEFQILLPAATEDSERAFPAPDSQVQNEAKGETILLVEDDDDVRAYARSVLLSHGYQVYDAPGPETARQISQSKDLKIDLLLTDVVLPQTNGRALANELSRHQPEMRVLFMSGYTDDAIVQHGILDPGINYLPKPFSPATLLANVQQVIAGKRPRQTVVIAGTEVTREQFADSLEELDFHVLCVPIERLKDLHTRRVPVDFLVLLLPHDHPPGLESVRTVHDLFRNVRMLAALPRPPAAGEQQALLEAGADRIIDSHAPDAICAELRRMTGR